MSRIDIKYGIAAKHEEYKPVFFIIDDTILDMQTLLILLASYLLYYIGQEGAGLIIYLIVSVNWIRYKA